MTIATVSGTTTTTATYNGDGDQVTTSYVNDVNSRLPVVLTDGTTKYGLGLAYAVDYSGSGKTGQLKGAK